MISLGLAACGGPVASPPVTTTASSQTVATSPTERPYYSAADRPASNGAPARCNAEELQWLVGRQRSEIPVPVDVVNRRVTCTTCAVNEDHRPDRLNIFYDRQTGRIQSVSCG